MELDGLQIKHDEEGGSNIDTTPMKMRLMQEHDHE